MGGRVAQLLGVHGIGQEQLGRHQILERWTPALADGLERAAGRSVRRPDLDLAFYGHLFFPVPPEGKAAPSPVDPAMLADLDEVEIDELTEAVTEIVTPADLSAADAGSAEAYKTLGPLPVRVVNLIGAVERRFPPASGVLCLGTLRQVRRYLRDPQLKADVDEITAEATAGATVLIGHSLGSVVAYEFLRQHPGHSVKLLLTIGSPLGLRMVRSQLQAGELGPVHWVNVRALNDPVTAAGALNQWYPGVTETQPVKNGKDSHAASHYLGKKAVGIAVLEAFPELGQ
jgi:hypothetical protein